MKREYYHYRTIYLLIAITVVLFIGFDALARNSAHAVIMKQYQNQAHYQAEVISELIRDMEIGYAEIDSSMPPGSGKTLQAHVQVVRAMIDGSREGEASNELSTQEIQRVMLDEIAAYRASMEGTLAIYSTHQGMLLYPEGDQGRLNVYFNAGNRSLMQKVVRKGEGFGEIEYSSIIQGDIVLSGYFLYDPEWSWLIFAVDANQNKTAARQWVETLTIDSGLRSAEAFRGVSAAYVLDSRYKVAYGADTFETGQSLDDVDLITGQPVTELMKDASGTFVEYALADPQTGSVSMHMAHISQVAKGRYVSVVEMDMNRMNQVVASIVSRIRILMAGAAAALAATLFILYQNFVILVDPISEQREAKT